MFSAASARSASQAGVAQRRHIRTLARSRHRRPLIRNISGTSAPCPAVRTTAPGIGSRLSGGGVFIAGDGAHRRVWFWRGRFWIAGLAVDVVPVLDDLRKRKHLFPAAPAHVGELSTRLRVPSPRRPQAGQEPSTLPPRAVAPLSGVVFRSPCSARWSVRASRLPCGAGASLCPTHQRTSRILFLPQPGCSTPLLFVAAMASVWKPIRRLDRIAARVVGPARTTRYLC